MKRTRLTTSLGLALLATCASILLNGCTGTGKQETTDSSAQPGDKAAQYTCSMHPEVVKDKPGDCPKCGMKLVQKK